MSIYNIEVKTIKGENISLKQFEGKVLLIVNTASKCGFTPQYKELQEVYDEFHHLGFEVLGFPCNQFGNQEPGNESTIESFCSLNYGVSFPMFAKVDVNGNDTHPLFQYLKDAAPGVLGSKSIKWNFTKFLVSPDGTEVIRFASKSSPKECLSDIKKMLQK